MKRPEITKKESEKIYKTYANLRLNKRALGILPAMEGKKYKEIAAFLKISDNMVTNTIKRFNEKGLKGLVDAPRSGRRSWISPKLEEKFLEALEELHVNMALILMLGRPRPRSNS